jgi:hypothetical protein
VGAAFSRDLFGQSRLKTAPTIQKQQIQNFKVSFLIRLDARGQRRRSYETRPKWHSFFFDQTRRSWPGGARMKHHSIRQDLQDYQDVLGLAQEYLVNPVDPVRKINLYFVYFLSD